LLQRRGEKGEGAAGGIWKDHEVGWRENPALAQNARTLLLVVSNYFNAGRSGRSRVVRETVLQRVRSPSVHLMCNCAALHSPFWCGLGRRKHAAFPFRARFPDFDSGFCGDGFALACLSRALTSGIDEIAFPVGGRFLRDHRCAGGTKRCAGLGDDLAEG